VAQRERHREDGGDETTALGFKRHFVLPGLALALLELAAIAWPVLSLFRPAMGDRAILLRIAIPVLACAQLTWWAAIGSWLSPIYRAIQTKRRGQRLPDDLAESAYRSTWRLPRRALLLRVSLWMSIAVAHGLYLDHYGDWTTKQVIELSAVTGLCAFAVSLVRSVWYQLILARLRRRLFAGVAPLKEFSDGYFGVLMHVAMVVSAGTAVAIAAFTYYFLPISFEQTLQLHLVIPAALLLALVGMTVVTSHACRVVEAYLRGSTAEREALSTRVYRRAQALAYRLALAHICVWGLAAGSASWLARRTLGFAFDDSILKLAIWLDIAIGASIYQVLWHRDAVRPLLDQLTLRHHLPVRAIRPSLSLRGKLLLSFGGLVLFAVGLALFWGFIQYKNLVTEFTWKQADLGLTWLRSEVQGAAAARETAPTPDLVHEVLHQVAGHYEARAAQEEKAKEASAKPPVGGGGGGEGAGAAAAPAAPPARGGASTGTGTAPASGPAAAASAAPAAPASPAAAAPAAPAASAAPATPAAEVSAAEVPAPPDRTGPRAPEATSAVFYYVSNRPGAAVVAAGGGIMGAPDLPWYARAQLQLTSAADAHIGLDAYSLAGRRGRLVVTWRDMRHDLGGLAVFYPNYRGRGPSLVRPVKELLFFFLVLFGTCAGFVVFTVGQFVKPIRRLEQRADGMARGELAQPVSSGGEGDEIGRLTFALEQMRRALREKLRSTEEVNLDLERAVQRRTADLAKKNRELAETLEKLTRAQDQLVRAEKMASIGQLVAGIAHEINNPVNAIVNTVGPLEEAIQEIVRDDLAGVESAHGEVVEMLRVVQRGAQRTKAIVQALHNYSRTDDESVVEVDLNRSLDDSLELLRHLLKQSIQVERDYGAVGRIRGHAGQLNQVFMNLLTNAAQAVAGRDSATIWVATYENPSGVTIEVRDNGRGIPSEVLPRIFDPFFTTKDVGEGSGLGLSIVHGIVERHGGSIEVDSTPEIGTRFRVHLPRGGLERTAEVVRSSSGSAG
jgi:signal transduction histidine kinase